MRIAKTTLSGEPRTISNRRLDAFCGPLSRFISVRLQSVPARWADSVCSVLLVQSSCGPLGRLHPVVAPVLRLKTQPIPQDIRDGSGSAMIPVPKSRSGASSCRAADEFCATGVISPNAFLACVSVSGTRLTRANAADSAIQLHAESTIIAATSYSDRILQFAGWGHRGQAGQAAVQNCSLFRLERDAASDLERNYAPWKISSRSGSEPPQLRHGGPYWSARSFSLSSGPCTASACPRIPFGCSGSGGRMQAGSLSRLFGSGPQLSSRHYCGCWP